jgi:CRISPR-associated protein Cas2
MPEQELRTLVIYDVADDRTRLKLAKACKDYGLEHIQYSAFAGPLGATQRKQLCARLIDTLGQRPGRLLLVPICQADVAASHEIWNA